MYVYMGEDKTKTDTDTAPKKNKYKVQDWFSTASSKIQDTGLSVNTGKGGFNIVGKSAGTPQQQSSQSSGIMDKVKGNIPIVIGAGILIVALVLMKK